MSPYWKAAIWAQVGLSILIGFVFAVVVSFYTSFITMVLARTPVTEENRKKMRRNFIKWIFYDILIVAGVFAFADGIILAGPYLWGGYVHVLAWLGVQATQTGIAALVVGIGYGAFQFKEHHKKWYGRVEVGFSAVSVVVALMTTKPDNRVGLVITILGAMYVSSRGFGNWLGKSKD
jgi:hypothetical protein